MLFYSQRLNGSVVSILGGLLSGLTPMLNLSELGRSQPYAIQKVLEGG
jgi:hypothetical protein